MITADVVTIVVNGTIVTSSSPARIRSGRVVAPLTPIVVRLVSRAVYAPATSSVEIERNGTRMVVRVAFVENNVPYVELAPIVRGIGGNAAFDAPTKTFAVVLAPGGPIATPWPFDPAAPRVQPTTVFTPSPPPAAPRSIETGVPRPRRTAIPALPSQPAGPAEPGL